MISSYSRSAPVFLQRLTNDGSTMVMYDYDRLQKGTMTDEFREALEARIPK